MLTGVRTGYGMQTWWNLSGLPETYAGALSYTDGYKVTASVLWRDYSIVTGTSTPTAFVVGNNGVLGTCVETLDEDGVILAAGINTEGNYALCHWFYVTL